MISFLINAFKIVFALGVLILIHEGAHFIVSKLCKVKVNEFSIGFGPALLKKQGKQTLYTIRLIPLGGYVQLEGENEQSEEEGSFSKASIPKRMAIVLAGAIVNIIFAIIVFYILMVIILNSANPNNTLLNNMNDAVLKTKNFIFSIFESLRQLFTGQVGINQFTGPIGISEVIINTSGIQEYFYIIALISLSLGVTNLLPIPALDGGKFLLLIIELIRGKKLSEKLEINLQLIGFAFLITLSIYVAYNDILRII